jgi:hypothetical protein
VCGTHIYNPSTQQAEAGGPKVGGWPGLLSDTPSQKTTKETMLKNLSYETITRKY